MPRGGGGGAYFVSVGRDVHPKGVQSGTGVYCIVPILMYLSGRGPCLSGKGCKVSFA